MSHPPNCDCNAPYPCARAATEEPTSAYEALLALLLQRTRRSLDYNEAADAIDAYAKEILAMVLASQSDSGAIDPIRHIVDAAPVLTFEQAEKIRKLLAPEVHADD